MRERRGRLRGQLTRVDHVKSAGVTLLHVTHHETGGRQKIALRSKFPREQSHWSGHTRVAVKSSGKPPFLKSSCLQSRLLQG